MSSLESSFDDTFPNLGLDEFQVIQEKFSYISCFSNARASFQKTPQAKSSSPSNLLNLPGTTFSTSCFQTPKHNQSPLSFGQAATETAAKTWALSQNSNLSFAADSPKLDEDEDEAEVCCDEMSDINFKHPVLTNASLMKQPSKNSIFLQREERF